MAKYTGGTVTSKDRSSGIKDLGSDTRRAYAEYREANQPQMRITRRRLDTRATHTLPDGASKKQNKPSLPTRTRQFIPDSGVARGTALPSSGSRNPAPTMARQPVNPDSKPTRGFSDRTEKNLRQVGKRNKTK